ncbi:hypothetical protein C2G38_2095272, partial [Gigaspora rosea]
MRHFYGNSDFTFCLELVVTFQAIIFSKKWFLGVTILKAHTCTICFKINSQSTRLQFTIISEYYNNGKKYVL